VKARGIIIAAAVITASAVFAGCGEKPNVTVYKQGSYQGKPDSLPWQGAPFNNNQVEWEKAIKARNNAQNEYLRVGTN
jgi:hypothetical protein